MCTYASVVISRTILLLISPLFSRVLNDINWSALNWPKHLTLKSTIFSSRNGRSMGLATQFSNGFIFTDQIGSSVWELTDIHPIFCPSIKVSLEEPSLDFYSTRRISLYWMRRFQTLLPFLITNPSFPSALDIRLSQIRCTKISS